MPPFLLHSLLHAMSAAGFGLLMWTAMTIALLQVRGVAAPSLQQLQWLTLLIGGVLVAVGLITTAVGRARWPRASVAARGTWESRTTWASMLTVLLALGLVVVLQFFPAVSPRVMALAALALLLASLAAVAFAALARAKTVPAVATWRHPLALPIRLLIAMAGGLSALYLLMSLLFVSGSDGAVMLMTLAVLGTGIAACLWLQWRDADRDAVDRPVLECHQPATQQRRQRRTIAALFALTPLAAWMLATLHLIPAPVLLLITGLSLLAGTALGRLLFLAAAAPDAPPPSVL